MTTTTTNYQRIKPEHARPTADYPNEDMCLAELEGQEDVRCHLKAKHGRVHEAFVQPPCDACGGLDMHREDCAWLPVMWVIEAALRVWLRDDRPEIFITWVTST